MYSGNSLHIYKRLPDVFYPLHPNISMHILYTVLYTFPNGLARRIFSIIQGLQLIVISFILMTLMFDSGVILKGEIRCQSLSGMKVLTTVHILYASCICWQQ